MTWAYQQFWLRSTLPTGLPCVAPSCRTARSRVARRLADAGRLYRWELRHARKADLVLAASEQEAGILRRHGIARASAAVPNGVDVTAFEPCGPRNETRDLLFVGYFLHTPNVDGLRYFISEIWPQVRAVRHQVDLTIIGSDSAA